MITITEKEYEELTCYKEMFLDAMMIKKKIGSSYRRYKELKEQDEFFKQRYGEVYKKMLKEYRDQREYSNLN